MVFYEGIRNAFCAMNSHIFQSFINNSPRITGKKNEYRKDKCKKQHSCATGLKTLKEKKRPRVYENKIKMRECPFFFFFFFFFNNQPLSAILSLND